MSSRAPLLRSASRLPPWPSGLIATCPLPLSSSLPFWSKAGIMPCVKKNTSLGLRPKKLFRRKNARVWTSLAWLVMMYQGTAVFARRPAARICSAKTWKSDLFWTGVTSKQPLGPSKPSRVPCPPATTKAATFPSAISSSPRLRALAHSSAVSPAGWAGTISGGTISPGALNSGWFRTYCSTYSSMLPQSTADSCSSSAVCSGSDNSS